MLPACLLAADGAATDGASCEVRTELGGALASLLHLLLLSTMSCRSWPLHAVMELLLAAATAAAQSTAGEPASDSEHSVRPLLL
jgi:hypothetical protein